MHRATKAALLAPVLALSACASTPKPAATTPVAVRPPTYSRVGLEAVMGRTAAALQAEFGRADLDVQEGSARKLQFGGAICVLDAYLYPPPRGGEPIVTYIDARQPDGRDMDRASCVAALHRRPEAN